MIPILYPADSTQWWSNNGLGGLPDAINCIVTEQRNTAGGYWLEMDYPVDGLHFDLLAPERIIYAAPAMGQRPQPFRISRITRPINGIVHIEAPHISVELQKLTTFGTSIGTNIGAMGRGFFAKAREIGQSTHFDFASNVTASSEITISHPEPVPMIDVLLGAEGSILDLVGGEYEFDEFDVVLHAQRGVDSGLEIRYGVNMSDLEAETDATELVTACVPYWKGTVNEQDVIVMGTMCTADNASAYAYVRCVPLDVTEQFDLEQDQQPTTAQVTAKGTAFINSTSRKLLQTSIKVKYEPTTNGIGERLINLCDTVRVVYPDLNVSSISKVVETKFNVLIERYDELTIGSIRNNIVDTIAGLISGGVTYSGGGSGSGGGGSSVGAVLYNMPQNLNEAQKAQARQNIGVGSGGGGGAVDSVNGQTGVVVLDAEDVGAVSTVNVIAYGAKGDGTTDDTTAIQNAIDYAQTNGIRDVYFPAGTYKITAPLRVTVATGTTPATGKPMYYYGLGCRLRGESIGTTIISKVGTGTMTIPTTDAYRGGETLDTVIYLGGTNGTGLFISDMTIENGSSATDAWCVYATRARVAIDRANIASNSHGVFCYGWTNTLQDVVASCSSKAIEMTNCTSSVLNKVWANGENPYTINASYSTLISCCGDGCTGSVFTLTGNVAMIGCGSESAGCDRYIDATGAGTVITVENFFAWAFSSAGKSYFRASGGAVLAINGVRLANNESSVSGAYMLAATTAARFALKNCNVYDNGGGTAYPTLTGGLPSGTQLAIDYGSYHGRYSVDSNGNIMPEEIGIDAFFDITGGHYAEVWDFTNRYTAKEDGYSYSSGANSTKSASSGYSVTNLVPAVMGDVIRTAGIDLRSGDMTLSELVFFDSTQTAIFATIIYNLTGQGSIDWGGTLDADGNLTYTINNDRAAAIRNTAYICVATRTTNFGSDPAISVNEEIKTKIEYVSGSVTLKDGIKVQQTPTEDNEPASKKYVDDATAAELPTVTASDNGKVLSVVNGSWAKSGAISYLVEVGTDGLIEDWSSDLTYTTVKSLIYSGVRIFLDIWFENSLVQIPLLQSMANGTTEPIVFAGPIRHTNGDITEAVFLLDSSNNLTVSYTARENALRKVTDLASYYASELFYPSVKGVWDTFQRKPVVVWEVADVSQGLIALNTNISSSLAWQLTGLNLSPYKRIKIYAKAGRKTGAMAADSSIVPAAIIEMLLDDRAKETVSQNVFIGSAVVQNPNDANRLGMLTCAVSGDKTKFAVVRATSLYGTAATSNTDCYQYVFKIEGYYD